MKHTLFFLLLLVSLFSCQKNQDNISGNTKPPVDPEVSSFPHPDHIIFVWFENKNYDSIVGNSDAPYINSLITKGTLFTNMFAVTHPSYPNYVDFFAGDSNGVVSDKCIDPAKFTTPNLYTVLNAVGKSFAWYSEGLPETGNTACFAPNFYAAKHNPTTIFANVPGSANKRFADLPEDFSKLENVVCITPNLQNDMHDGSIATGDTWLKTNLSSLADWCMTHNSVFVVYFDENDGEEGNRIPVVAVGEHVKPNYQHSRTYNHFNWTRSISAMFGANETWATNLNARDSIKGCWQ